MIGRFIQEDTYLGDGLNLFAYCQNNPLVYWDPTGHICEAKYNSLKNKNVSELTVQDIQDIYEYEKDNHLLEQNLLQQGIPPKYVNDVMTALDNQHMSKEKHLKYRRFHKKTVASGFNINTLSGWARLKNKQEIQDFSRDVSTIEIIEKANEMNVELTCSCYDHGISGQYYASHAEKQLSMLSNDPIGISRDMCQDCEHFLNVKAQSEEITIVTADPTNIRIFESDGSILLFARR